MNHDICIHSVKKITLRAKVLTADDGDTVSVLRIRFSDGRGPLDGLMTAVTAFLRADVTIADLDTIPLVKNDGGDNPWREINLTAGDVDVDVDNG